MALLRVLWIALNQAVVEAEFIKLGHRLFGVIKASFLASSKSWARCASRAFSFV